MVFDASAISSAETSVYCAMALRISSSRFWMIGAEEPMLDGQEGIGVELPAEVLDGFANRSGMRRQVEEAEVNEGGIEAGMSTHGGPVRRSPYCRGCARRRAG